MSIVLGTWGQGIRTPGLGGKSIQVMADYTGDLQFCPEVGHVAGHAEATALWRKRAVRYISKSNGDSDKPKARKRRRIKSMHWGLALDNCLSYCTGVGLETFSINSATLASCPFEWPSLTVVPDQGSDGFCMINAFQKGCDGVKFNVGVYWDKFHGAHNDVKLAVKKAGLRGFCLISAVAAAAPHSPWNTGTRRIQTWEAMTEYLENHDCDEEISVSVQADLLADDGEAHRITEPNIAQTKWNELLAESIFRKSTPPNYYCSDFNLWWLMPGVNCLDGPDSS